jgi:hypothetical protein
MNIYFRRKFSHFIGSVFRVHLFDILPLSPMLMGLTIVNYNVTFET